MLLKEDDSDLARKAMEASLDDGTDPNDFDVNVEPDVNTEVDSVSRQAADAMSQKNQQMIDELQGWIDDIEAFLKRVNSEDPSSIQSRLAAAEPDTVMDKMKQSQQTKISRVAADLASLHQNFLGFMAQTANSRYKYVVWPFIGALSFLSEAFTYFG